jgi:mRNA turnover protein 4
MPKSKRDKVVTLSKVKKKPKDAREKLVDSIRAAVGEAKHIYLLTIENEKNDLLKLVRAALRPGTIFCGKNKVMQLALGTMPETECEDNLRVLAKRIGGSCALLCTTEPLSKVRKALADVTPTVFARCGSTASKTVKLKAGTQDLRSFPHSAEPHLRGLGLPTLLKDGIIHLMGDHTVCTEGETLSGEKALLLKQLGIPMVKFQVTVAARWSRKGCETEVYA